MRWGCVIAGGGRESGVMAQAMGTERKSLCIFAGRPSIARVLDAVRDASISACASVSGEDVQPAIHHGCFVPEKDGAISNVAAGLAAIRSEVDACLFVPSDSPLLTGQSLRAFCERIERRATGEWLAVGLCPTAEFNRAYPGTPASSIRLREGNFVSGALYAGTPNSIDRCLGLLRELRASRKSQARMALRIGIGRALQFGAGRMNRERAESALSKVAGLPVLIDLEAEPCTCMDFDDLAELAALRRHF